jgi:hypothetical protein
VTDQGVVLDATFWVEAGDAGPEIVFLHRARGRNDPAAVNRDYMEGLELLLDRLRAVGARIDRIEVDSRVAHTRPADERVLPLRFPIALLRDTDIGSLRVRITEAQRSVARRATAKPGGGNNQKRIRIWISHRAALTLTDLGDRLQQGV